MFNQKRVVITGGASGIGLALARSVAQHVGKAILRSRSQEKLARAAAELGDCVETLVLDVINEHAVAARFQELEPFDQLVTAAAGTARGNVLDLAGSVLWLDQP